MRSADCSYGPGAWATNFCRITGPPTTGAGVTNPSGGCPDMSGIWSRKSASRKNSALERDSNSGSHRCEGQRFRSRSYRLRALVREMPNCLRLRDLGFETARSSGEFVSTMPSADAGWEAGPLRRRRVHLQKPLASNGLRGRGSSGRPHGMPRSELGGRGWSLPRPREVRPFRSPM